MTEVNETARYFDEHCPEYSPGRLDPACEWIRVEVGSQASLLDVGCGTGNVLVHIRERTGITDLAGADPSRASLETLRERIDCPTYATSVLDPDLEGRIERRFDVVVVAAVLHHLVGRTRRESRHLATRGLTNALRLTRPGGHVIIVEPVFYPRLTMDLLFHVKRFVTRFTSRRLEILDTWNNIGAPVVSYLTNEELHFIANRAGGRVIARHIDDRNLHPLMRLGGIRRRLETTLVVERPGTT